MGIANSALRQPKSVGGRINKFIPQERLVINNFRLNDHGVNITKRLQSDNNRTILTGFGMQWGRSIGAVKQWAQDKTDINTSLMERASSLKVAQLINLDDYHPDVRLLYGNMPITRRSNFISDIFFEGLGGYGKNRDLELSWQVKKQAISYLNEKYFEYFSRDEFNFDLDEFIEEGRWLTHIRTGVNSGYPYNATQVKKDEPLTKQKKAVVSAWKHRGAYLKLMKKYLAGDKIDWLKLPFEMGMRTERNDSVRVIMQAPWFDKLSSSVVNTILDDHKFDLPLSIPRKYGSFDNLVKKIMNASGAIFCKDFEKFDRNIPIALFKLILEWFKSIDTMFCRLMCFEIELIINSIIILGPKVALRVFSLPSGVGITQFIGSLAHEIIDFVCGLVATFEVRQSDDVLVRTKMDEAECVQFIEQVEHDFGMPISPLGKKSLYSDSIGILLQKIIDIKNGIYYNHEPRGFNNGIFRERFYNIGEEFKILVGETDSKKALKKNTILSYLGNLSSYGANAPSLPYIWSFMLGKKSGFTKNQIQWGLKSFEVFDKYVKSSEQ